MTLQEVRLLGPADKANPDKQRPESVRFRGSTSKNRHKLLTIRSGGLREGMRNTGRGGGGRRYVSARMCRMVLGGAGGQWNIKDVMFHCQVGYGRFGRSLCELHQGLYTLKPIARTGI